MKYKILIADIIDLEDKVIEAMQDGWIPVGGPFFIYTVSNEFGQAMVKSDVSNH